MEKALFAKLSMSPMFFSAFDCFQIFSKNPSSLTFDNFSKFFKGQILCDSEFASSSCSSSNGIRVVRLASLKAVGPISMRRFPIFILLRLGLIDQAMPISYYYFKVRLSNDVSDGKFQSLVTRFNTISQLNMYHSFYTGDATLLFRKDSVAPRPPKPLASSISDAKQRHYLILDNPPLSVDEKSACNLVQNVFHCDVNPSVRWAAGPLGTSIVIEYDYTAVSPPAQIQIGCKKYALLE